MAKTALRAITGALCIALTMAAGGTSHLAAAPPEPGFVPLFDGKTLNGWETPDMSCWSVQDGAITGRITPEHPIKSNQYLVWHEPMGDFELKLQFRMFGSHGINSGFQFRSRIIPGHDLAGYQMDNNLDTPWLCRLYEEHGRETLAFRGKRADIDPTGSSRLSDISDAGGTPWFRLEDWHEYHLIAQGTHLSLFVNGKPAAEVLDGDAQRAAISGVLGLQLHTGPPTTVQFRNIRLRTLKPGAKPTAVIRPVAERATSTAAIADKTLVAWVVPANLTQHGGSVLTLDDRRGHFDGIVFGETAPARWVTGSEFYHRTDRGVAAAAPAETGGAEPIQMAAVYRGREVTLYRNGKVYSHHTVAEPQSFVTDSTTIIGLRHLEAGDRACFAGSVLDARIYRAPLTAEELEALRPGTMGSTKPYAWWNFARGNGKDVMGRYPAAKLVGNARVAGGRLQLDGEGSYMVSPPESGQTPDAAQLPVYHFTSPTGQDCMPFDPNGAVYFHGRYHLGYIYQQEGRHYWGHVSSTDLLHWKQQLPMLSPGPEAGIFSGNAFITKEGHVALSYHGLGTDNPHHDAGNCIAISRDPDLNSFKKLPENPVMKNPGWDPHTWLQGSTYYSISGGNPGSGRGPSIYRANDDSLAHWTLLGPLLSHDMPDIFPEEDISCPDLFTLGEKQILLCISHSRGARYYTGHFENGKFTPEAHHRMNWPGGTCFAPETLLDAKGRRIMWGWVLGSPSTMTLPRVLTPGEDGALNIAPVQELTQLRRAHTAAGATKVAAGDTMPIAAIAGVCKEIDAEFSANSAAAEYGLKVRRSPDGMEETTIRYIPARGVLQIDVERSTLTPGIKPKTYAMSFMLAQGAPNPDVTVQEAPFALKPGEPLKLRVFLDHSIIEVYANGRQCLTQRIWPTRADSTGIALFANGGEAELNAINAWDMAPITIARLKSGAH